MTNAIESEQLTRVGPGTMMGDLMRQYWLPAVKSSEVVAGGDPLRLMLLGEKLIAFRDHAGRVGVMDHRCPHRCASLFFGRNEEGGIRCVYHGWKFDADGNCVDMPNLPPEQDFRQKVHAKAYKVAERAGVIWVYMGARAEAPPMPEIEATLLPESELSITFTQRECNWLQALEGDIDTSHFSWLHVGSVRPEQVDPDNWLMYQVSNRAPDYHVTDTDWGTMYCAYRPADDGKTYWRFAHFGFPFWTFIPQGDFMDRVIARAWVPMDDTHVMFVGWTWKQASRTAALAGGEPIPGATPAPDTAAEHHRLVRPLASGAERGERLPDRSRGAAQRRDLHRHHAHRDAGPGDHREHGRDRRSLVRASGAERSDDHAHAAAAADGGAGVAREGRGAALRRSAGHLPAGAQRRGGAGRRMTGRTAYRDRLRQVVRPTGWRERRSDRCHPREAGQ